jgi:DNA-binding NtrC family response regulator
VVEWLTISSREEEIRPEHLPAYLRTAEPAAPTVKNAGVSLLSFGLSVDELEKAMLEEALEKAVGNVSEASRLLKVTRNTLRYRMAKYNIK